MKDILWVMNGILYIKQGGGGGGLPLNCLFLYLSLRSMYGMGHFWVMLISSIIWGIPYIFLLNSRRWGPSLCSNKKIGKGSNILAL